MWITKTPLSEGQMAIFKSINIKIKFSVYGIYATYLFRPKDLAAIWLLIQEILGPEICELSSLA